MASKNELRLAEFVELQAKIKPLTKRLDVLKAEIKEVGTHSTQNYSAIIEFVTRTGIDAEAVKALLGAKTPMADTSYSTVKVVAKTLV